LSPYTVLDIAASRRIWSMELFGEIGNVTDEQYTPAGYQTIDEAGTEVPLYFPAASRNYRLGIRLELTRSD
jgi:hypothetical protein